MECDLIVNIIDIICDDNGIIDLLDDIFIFILIVIDGELEGLGWFFIGDEGFMGIFVEFK